MSRSQTCVLFASRPGGWPDASTFEVAERPVPEPGDGDVLVKNLCLSVDPYMRGRMNDRKSYIPPFQVGEVLQGGVVGRVAASNSPKFAVGDAVTGLLGWEEYSLVPRGRGIMKIDAAAGFPLSWYLGVLGMPGMTAWVGLDLIGQPKDGETAVISAAAGAVGQIAGQICRLKGARVVGTAGSDAKVEYVRSLGFDAAFNYRTVESLGGALAEHCPKGIDVYYDNVGGQMLDAVLARINRFARLVECGMISQYNLERPEPVHNLIQLVGNAARMQGFIVTDHYARMPEFMAEMTGWLKDGRITYREDVADGLASAPQAFIGMLKGENFGKQVVRIAEDG